MRQITIIILLIFAAAALIMAASDLILGRTRADRSRGQRHLLLCVIYGTLAALAANVP